MNNLNLTITQIVGNTDANEGENVDYEVIASKSIEIDNFAQLESAQPKAIN